MIKAVGKFIHIGINNSNGKQQTITENKTTLCKNGVAFQLQTINSSEMMSSQYEEKTELKMKFFLIDRSIVGLLSF